MLDRNAVRISKFHIDPFDGLCDGSNSFFRPPTFARSSAVPWVLLTAGQTDSVDQLSRIRASNGLGCTFSRGTLFNNSNFLTNSDSVQVFDAGVVIEQLHIRDFEALFDPRDGVSGLHSVGLGTKLKNRCSSRDFELHPNTDAVPVFESVSTYNLVDGCTVFLGDTSQIFARPYPVRDDFDSAPHRLGLSNARVLWQP